MPGMYDATRPTTVRTSGAGNGPRRATAVTAGTVATRKEMQRAACTRPVFQSTRAGRLSDLTGRPSYGVDVTPPPTRQQPPQGGRHEQAQRVHRHRRRRAGGRIGGWGRG